MSVDVTLVLAYGGEEYVETRIVCAGRPPRDAEVAHNTARTGYQMRRALDLQAAALTTSADRVRVGAASSTRSANPRPYRSWRNAPSFSTQGNAPTGIVPSTTWYHRRPRSLTNATRTFRSGAGPNLCTAMVGRPPTPNTAGPADSMARSAIGDVPAGDLEHAGALELLVVDGFEQVGGVMPQGFDARPLWIGGAASVVAEAGHASAVRAFA